MELGNLLLGNSRGSFKFPNRDLVDSEEWEKLAELVKINDSISFENEIFITRPYYWGECTCGADKSKEDLPHKQECKLLEHNFIYKPTGFSIDWYKYPFRDSYMSVDLTEDELKEIWTYCIESLINNA